MYTNTKGYLKNKIIVVYHPVFHHSYKHFSMKKVKATECAITIYTKVISFIYSKLFSLEKVDAVTYFVIIIIKVTFLV